MSDKFYITTAIDYVNDKPHLGHALEKLQADVLARYERQQGKEVMFVTGTDEHGVKIARSAEKAGRPTQEFVDDNAKKFLAMKESMGLSYDDFIRTSDKERHWPGVAKMWSLIAEKGDIYKKSYKGLYCVGHEAFVTDKDLVDGKCKDHAKEPEVIEEENYFFKLSKYGPQIKEKIESGEFRIVPETRKNEILSLIDQGLEDVSFSRPRKDLSWGIPVPGDEDQTIYVWADALTNYISAVGFGRGEEYSKWWPADAQVIGKDILRFHAAIWPGMLISAGLPIPKKLVVHGFITVEGQKMSKTIGNVIDPIELINKFGTDPVRFYLLKEITSSEDGDFSEAKFRALYNGDLANGIGNFAARISTMSLGLEPMTSGIDRDMLSKIDETRETIKKKMDEFRLNEAVSAITDLVRAGDKYINENKIWKIEDLEEKRARLSTMLWTLRYAAVFLEPFIPQTSARILEKIVLEKDAISVSGKIENLFPRLG